MEALPIESKIAVPGFRIGKLLYKSSSSLYFSGYQSDRNRRIIIRLLKKKQLTKDEIDRFKKRIHSS